MRNRILAIAAIAGAISAPIAAQAQSTITTGVVRGGSVIVNETNGRYFETAAGRTVLVSARWKMGF